MRIRLSSASFFLNIRLTHLRPVKRLAKPYSNKAGYQGIDRIYDVQFEPATPGVRLPDILLTGFTYRDVSIVPPLTAT